MTFGRWQELKQLFEAALACEPDERAALLSRRCAHDKELLKEAQRLINAHEESGEFIETPAYEWAPELLENDCEELVGKKLGAYRVDAVLGSGGMGVVYLAFDERLERKVALKLLPASLVANSVQLERLRREARIASALNHPNIVTVYEIGEAAGTYYIATEFVDGITLRERLRKGSISPNESLDIAIQVASALSVAHRAGIVHRDIKPENIMLRPDGYVKVLDFGIAQAASPVENSATPDGNIVGTASYMSPEQASGKSVDARGDLWALGVVFYEMLAGRAPFFGETPKEVIAAILGHEPPPLEKSPALQKVVAKALRKNCADRYLDAEAMLADLRAIKEGAGRIVPQRRARRLTSAAAALLLCFTIFYIWRAERTPAATEKSIAVLPFENLSDEPNNAFLADGIQEDILTSVGKIKDLKVIARTSVMGYRGTRAIEKVREIGRRLNASYILEGDVRRAGDHVVVNVALIDARNDHQLWSERYERTLTDSLSLQGELAMEIARSLHAKLTPAETSLAATKPTHDEQAYLSYLRGREIEIRADSPEVNEAAIKLYQQAVDRDPDFAMARARLSLCATDQANWGNSQPWKTKARVEAEEAIRLRPNLGEAHLALAHCYTFNESDYDRASQQLKQAAELSPNSAEVYLAAAFVYKRQAKWRERIAALQKAEALDPLNPRVGGTAAHTYQWLREWREAIRSADRVAALMPDGGGYFMAWDHATEEFRLTGDINVLKKALAVQPKNSSDRDYLQFARYETAVLERDFAGAAQLLTTIPSELLGQGNYPPTSHLKVFHEALLAVAMRAETKEQSLQVARDTLEKRLDHVGLDRPYNDLALIEALLGRKEEAIRRAYEAVDNQTGTIEKNSASAALALVYAHVGEPEKAIDLIEQLLTLPSEMQPGTVYNITLADLKWRWVWDPLRTHPRFQKLLASPEPKTVY